MATPLREQLNKELSEGMKRARPNINIDNQAAADLAKNMATLVDAVCRQLEHQQQGFMATLQSVQSALDANTAALKTLSERPAPNVEVGSPNVTVAAGGRSYGIEVDGPNGMISGRITPDKVS